MKIGSIKSKEVLSHIINIINIQLGDSYVSIEEMNQFFDQKNVLIHVAEIEQQIVAFSISQIMDENSIVDLLDSKPNFNPSFFKKDLRYAYRFLTAVHPDHERKGIGQALIDYGINELKDKVDYIFCDAWKSKYGTHIHYNLIKAGYQKQEEIGNYWLQESQQKGYTCAVCKGDCYCTAVLYVVDLN